MVIIMYEKKKCIIYGGGVSLLNLLKKSNIVHQLFEIVAITDKKYDAAAPEALKAEMTNWGGAMH